MSKRIAIVQSSYIPWKGYFDLIRSVDEFVFLDDAQFTRRDWRNRNLIKTAAGPRWLTIPVESKGRYEDPIDAIRVAGTWADNHWAQIRHAYARAPHFATLGPVIEAMYGELGRQSMLSGINRLAIETLCPLLGISTPLRWSREYPVAGRKTDRLLSICRAAGATEYLSGPSARSYMELEKFEACGIAVCFADYAGYPEYPQMHGKFTHGVSVLDLLFNVGDAAAEYMRRLA